MSTMESCVDFFAYRGASVAMDKLPSVFVSLLSDLDVTFEPLKV
ncbi:MAG TPA: hypothetical protein QGG35_07370 [Candidatus Marinimicrobia bacterium]|jgi:hypothetical protein|nr:hypothetical protein [Candidatus Neomarinimicrobiota bacterium]